MDSKGGFYEWDIDFKKLMLECRFNKGKCIDHKSGMCGDIFVFDGGENTYPRYSCVKVPKRIHGVSDEEAAKRFVRELKLQLAFSKNEFVHWIFDLDSIFDGIPIASSRYWDTDLGQLIKAGQLSVMSKLSIMYYVCVGLKHCYNKGLNAHQDLKPANIFIRKLNNSFVNLPALDIFDYALVADFGLANASVDNNVFDGSRPYMAPEQWERTELSQATDVFALGVIFFEIITSGYHPNGIKLSDYWPVAQNGKTKKWTKPDKWREWISNGCIMNMRNDIISSDDILDFIKKMLSVNASDRPCIDEVISFLLDQIKRIDQDSYAGLINIMERSEKRSSQMSDLQTSWPYLYAKWAKLEAQYLKP